MRIDLNCDMGEGFGAWKMGTDDELMDHVSSINIACGFHAGDPSTMRRTAELGAKKGVAIGAHPGYPDLQGFGRRNMALSPGDVYDAVLYQIAAMKGICEAAGTALHHVKPHGALYNTAAKDRQIAAAIANAVRDLDPKLLLYGLSGSQLISEGEKCGLRTASEVFADRGYSEDGSLTPRGQAGALIEDLSQAVKQAMQLVTSQTVTSIAGATVAVKAETVCIHGDGENALEFARTINQEFRANGIEVGPI